MKVRFKNLKELGRAGIDVVHLSDDGEYIRFRKGPNGNPVIGMWVPRGPLTVVDFETVDKNVVDMFPEAFEVIEP